MITFKNVIDEIIAQLVVIKHLPKQPEKKFMLFARGRSGSGLLRSLINSHPDIYCDVEVYLHRKALFPRHYLNNKSRIAMRKVYGYKAKPRQLERQYKNPEKVLSKFFTDDYKIIYLYRTNIFRQALSGLIGSQRQKWHDKKAGALAGKQFYIDSKELLNSMGVLEQVIEREREMIKDRTFLPVSYEDDLFDERNHQQTLDRVFNFLGVESVPVSTKIVRTTTDNISDFVENHDEVIEAVKNSKYAAFLDQSPANG
ncbi:MAG: hypothetical protein R3220_11615 [Balneolaceae bacterium]|nr:hypothetical protein [Balneolaceae bacterium]